MKNVSTVSITEWGPKTISNDIKNIGNCTFPYPPVDNTPWFPDWRDLKPTGPMISDWRPTVLSNLGVNMAKEKEKLAQIKGLIQGARLAESTDKIEALLDKILQVIEE